MKRHLNISINSKVLFFPYKNVIEKIKHLHMTNTTLVLNYLTPASLCYNYNCPILSFFNPSRSIHWCFIKKVVRIFRAPSHYQHFKRNSIKINIFLCSKSKSKIKTKVTIKQNLGHFKATNQRLLIPFVTIHKCCCHPPGQYLLERLCFHFQKGPNFLRLSTFCFLFLLIF